MKFLLFFLIPFLSQSQIQPDKVKHFVAGTVISYTSSFVSYKLGASKKQAIFIGFGTAILAGLGKEIYDKTTGKGQPSFADFAWTGVGSMAGTVTFVFTIK